MGNNQPRLLISLGSLMLMAVAFGCSGRPSLPTSNLDPRTLSESIVQELDQDADGLVAEGECAPHGLRSAFARYDTNNDALLSAEEITQGVAKWASRMGLASVEVAVIVDGQPAADVTVTMTPDSYLNDYVSVAKGVTRASGVAKMQAQDVALPDELARQLLMYPGLYEVTFDSPAIKGSPVVQGIEITGPATGRRRIEFQITQGDATQSTPPE